ncbi:unnamed protein product [Nippostrongylus brasiliensis]|uniref:SCP domain-containing protein n=1 Tax=Nippostrongylus brasiliensis TaxID=27835 RepID=A0A158R0Z8_NIPBR|nr:unnamed protein product [Nippostrongylus brasiliensis]
MEGLTRNGREDSFPPGKNMYMLEWDCNLEHLAEWRLTSDCTLNATELVYNAESAVVVDHGSPYGDVDAMLNSIVDAGSKLHMTFEISITSPEAVSYVGSEALQPFVNMIQGKAARIGCSGKICAANPLSMPYGMASCVYNVSPIKQGDVIYERTTWPICSDNTRSIMCTTYVGSTCATNSNLTTRAIATTDYDGNNDYQHNDDAAVRLDHFCNTCAPQSHSRFGLNCQSDVITARGRSEVLAKINEVRASVVDGVTANGGQENFPPGKNMYLLEWDCNLERIAESRLTRNCELNTTKLTYHAESATVIDRESWYGDVDVMLNEIVYSSKKLYNEYSIRTTNPDSVTYVGSPALHPFVNASGTKRRDLRANELADLHRQYAEYSLHDILKFEMR